MTKKSISARDTGQFCGLSYEAEEFIGITGSSTRDVGFTAMDIYENSKTVFVEIELAGVKPKDVSVTLHGKKLVIKGKKYEPPAQPGATFYCAETAFGSFRRVFVLGSSVDSDNIEAIYKNGMLQLKIPKTKNADKSSSSIKVKINE